MANKSRIDLAFEMRGRGDAAPSIAASLGVHVRTVHKWFSRRRAPPVEAPPLAVPDGPAELHRVMVAAISHEAAALLQKVRSEPGGNSVHLARLARALRALGPSPTDESVAVARDGDGDALRAELLARLDRVLDEA